MKTIILLLIISLVSCKNLQNSEISENNLHSESLNNIMQTEIPKELAEYLLVELPEYIIVAESDYLNEIDLFIEKGSLPYFCEADFNGDEIEDYALLMKDTNSDTYLFFIRKKGSGFTNQIVERFFDCKEKLDIRISIEESGEWMSIDSSKTVPNDGILVEKLNESISYAYYWENNKFWKYYFD